MDAGWRTVSVSEETCNISLQNFWKGIKVWIDRPHIINPRIFAVNVIENVWLMQKENKPFKINADKIMKILEGVKLITAADLHNCFKDCFCITTCNDFPEEFVRKEDINGIMYEYFVQLRCLLPKRVKKFEPSSEIVLIDKNDGSVIFINNSEVKLVSGISPSFPYRLRCCNGRVHLDVHVDPDCGDALQENTLLWLQNRVLTKVARWSYYIPQIPIMPSLKEVSVNNYNKNYLHLKSKYGDELVKMWPECTDPLKFVYEDIGIAAYLLTLWEKERMLLNSTKKQTFIDLGCGNGVLVHILATEGHKGIGVDVRKRAIWDLYGPETQLIEKVYTPSEEMLFPEYDWIIGNHSDELTPWIPVIAARSSGKMRAFLLPCCCYTFNGKYQRGHGSVSNYQSYLEFLKQLCNKMGFNVTLDKLRIPSTKRICLICMSRNYEPEEETEVDKQRIKFIEQYSSKPRVPITSVIISSPEKLFYVGEKCENLSNSVMGKNSSNIVESKWESNFKPRDKKEIVNNCTALDRNFLNSMVLQIFKILFELSNDCIPLVIDGKEVNWRVGGKLSIGDLAQKLNENDLLHLKNQNGGLQTLLRNHKNIFNVMKGEVCLSIHSESSYQPSRKRKRGKQRSKKKNNRTPCKQSSCKPCFFYCYHPEGCPLPAGTCLYAHSFPGTLIG